MSRTPTNSKPRELKPEQKLAAHTLDRHLSVTAGPGAGKTTVLVERYLEILRTQNVSVDKIVAITFTNRAANEMRARVRGEIDEILRASTGDLRQRWLRHKRALESAVITTIHGFCSRLLREFPVEAELDPQFVLLEEHQAVMMLDAVVEETLTEAIQHGNEKIVQMTQGVGRGALAAALVELYQKHRGEGLAIADLESLTAANHARAADYATTAKQLDAAMNDLISARRLTKQTEERRAKAAQEWPALRAILSQPPAVQTIAAYCQAIEDFWETRPRKGTHPALPPVDELLWGIDPKKEEPYRGKLPSLGFDLLAKDYALALLKLLREIDRRLETEKDRLSVLDFDDLQLRALKLLERSDVLARVTDRYRFFLVDEFQDTNGLQRELMTRLGLVTGANLFIVGDRKQSIYGFRGADVDVFREMSEAIETAGGAQRPLDLNFRSQKPLIDAFNFLFARIFKARTEILPVDLIQLGFVNHEPSVPERGADHQPPLVELLVSVLPDARRRFTEEPEGDENGERDQPGARERDAEQIVERIQSLIEAPVEYRHIAILFRALTGVWPYENALRRAGIPYLTVQGKGFYQREEITDLIQLLRFLDNTTDEIALAAVLRSPLCGISDNALFALRCAPKFGETQASDRLQRRNLLRALRDQKEIQFIDEDERAQLEGSWRFLDSLIEQRHRYSISALLRNAVGKSEFMTVIAANFDGAQRIANVEKLFRLAEQLEKSGHLIRDFVNYVEQFEAAGGREGEGQMDESANVVRLMTIHQAKGLEFPIVIVPDLHREQKPRETWHILDRHKGFTVRVPDGRGQTVRGALFNELRQRVRWREEFEGMRLLYVAATRAEDRLILSGAVDRNELKGLGKTEREQWLAWIWQALKLDEFAPSGLHEFENAQFQLTIQRDSAIAKTDLERSRDAVERKVIDASRPLGELFPLLTPVDAQHGESLRRFSVTQLINFQRCARQYYFDRMLRAPAAEELAVWNDAEAPEPPANLTATLKGAVIHRFCETFHEGDDVGTRLGTSFDEVVSQRKAELVGRDFDIDRPEAVRALRPLAENYLVSEVFKRASQAHRLNGDTIISNPESAPGMWSELRFRLRRPLGILTGTIDKLLITPARKGDGVDVEIIDFKTNRFRSQSKQAAKQSQVAIAAALPEKTHSKLRSAPAQGLFDFEAKIDDASAPPANDFPVGESVTAQAEGIAHDYQLQMQSYALALRELLPANISIHNLRATLHFIDPNIEVSVASNLLEPANCARMIDDAMMQIASLEGSLDAEKFPPAPATHCRMCNFRELCPAGREWLRLHH
jgi:ATP-dependent helicase/nuclease subunit A